MSFFDLYRKSCKQPHSEEFVDSYFFRPLAYPIARSLLPLSAVTPNVVSVLSIFTGVIAAAVLLADFPHHMQVGAAVMVLCNLLDCADGMLARMRGTSSSTGRMIDGVADSSWTVMFSAATVLVVWREHHHPHWLGLAVVLAGAATILTSSAHLAMYDTHRNRWLRFTRPNFDEDDGEDYARGLRRFEAARAAGRVNPLMWVVWKLYLGFIKSQGDIIRWFDPYALALRPYDAETAERYRQAHRAPWLLFRVFFGSSSLAAGLALFAALDALDVYVILRLFVVNALFLFVAAPVTRRASRRLRAAVPAERAA